MSVYFKNYLRQIKFENTITISKYLKKMTPPETFSTSDGAIFLF